MHLTVRQATTLTAGLTALTAALALSLLLPPAALAQAPPSATDTSRGLSMQFADGRRTTQPLRPSGTTATTGFPTIPGADTSMDGAPLAGYRIAYVMDRDGRDALVTVSIRYGAPHKSIVEVATVRVSPDTPVTMSELRAYGVEPITFSIVPVAATGAYAPVSVSVSAQVDVRAEPIGPNASAYRVTVTNRSSVPLIWFHFQTYRGEHRSVSARKRGSRNLPVIGPNAEYVFEFTSAASRRSAGGEDVWEPQDRIEITSVMWQDGLVEGAREPAVQQAGFDTSRATSVRLLLGRLRGEPSIGRLRAEIARSMNFDPDTRSFRDALLADLDALERTQRTKSGQALDVWLAAAIAECQQWLARIVFPKS
ncbi:hypothetical protein BH24ACI5_BH24ACI5_09160 [soil metagenome]